MSFKIPRIPRPKWADAKPKGIHRALLRRVGFDERSAACISEYHDLVLARRSLACFFYCLFELVLFIVSGLNLFKALVDSLSNVPWIIVIINSGILVANTAKSYHESIKSYRKYVERASGAQYVEVDMGHYVRYKWTRAVSFAFIIVVIAIGTFSILYQNPLTANTVSDMLKFVVLVFAIVQSFVLTCWNIVVALFDLWGYDRKWLEIEI